MRFIWNNQKDLRKEKMLIYGDLEKFSIRQYKVHMTGLKT